MSIRADNLATKVEQSINDLRAAVETSTPEQWSRPASSRDAS